MSWLKDKIHKLDHFAGEEVHKAEHIAEAVVKAPVNLTVGLAKDELHSVQDLAHGDFKGALHEQGNAGVEFVEQPEAIAHAAGTDLKVVAEVAGGTAGFITGGPLGAMEGASAARHFGELADHIADHQTISASEIIQNASGIVMSAAGVPTADLPLANQAVQIAGQAIDSHHIDPKLISSDIGGYFGGPLGNAFGGVAGQAIAGHDINGNILKQELIQTGTGIVDRQLGVSPENTRNIQNSIGQVIHDGHLSTQGVANIAAQATDLPLANQAVHIAGQAIDGHIDPQLITRDIGGPLGNAFGGVAGQAIAGHNIDGNILKQEIIQTGTGIADHRLGASGEYIHNIENSIGQAIHDGNLSGHILSAQGLGNIAAQAEGVQLSNSHEYGNLGNSIGQAIGSPTFNIGHGLSDPALDHEPLHFDSTLPNEEQYLGYQSTSAHKHHHIYHAHHQDFHSGEPSANDQYLSQHYLHSQESYDPNSFGQPVDPQHGLTEHPVQTGEHFDVSSAGDHVNPDLHHHI